MKRDFTVCFKDLDGSVVEEKGVAITAELIACNALLMPRQEDVGLSGDEKVKRYKLAVKINGAREPVELVAEEVAMLKKLVGIAYAPLIVGQFYELMDADHEPLA